MQELSQWASSLNDVFSHWAFWAGLVSVILFSVSRFTETLPEADDDDLSLPLLPRSFTTAFRFWLAAFVYTGCYTFLYLLLLVAGTVPEWRAILSSLTDTPTDVWTGTPAWAALVATAVIPGLPGFSHVDRKLRTRLQDFASIPTKAEMLAREVLAKLNVDPPPEIDESSTSSKVMDAIAAHRARFERLRQIWPKLKEPRARARRRYTSFETVNQKTVDRLFREFSANPNRKRTLEKSSALYIEKKYRNALERLAKLMVCSTLVAEATEYRIRKQWQGLGVPIEDGGLNFDSNTLIGSIAAIIIAVPISCYIAVALYYLVDAPAEPSLRDALTQNAGLFFFWSVLTALIYIPPITVAAAGAMNFLDHEAAGIDQTLTDRVAGAAVTFVAAALLCFLVLLAYGVLLVPKVLGGDPVAIGRLAPWAVPPAAVATTFMLLSISPRKIKTGEKWGTLYYALYLSIVALIFSLIVAFILGPPPAKEMGTLPRDSFYYLAACAPLVIGAALGALLSGTRYPRVLLRRQSSPFT